MPSTSSCPGFRFLLGSVVSVFLSASAMGAESPFTSLGDARAPTLYLAQLDDDDDFDDDDFDDEDFDEDDDFDDDDLDDDIEDDLEDELEDELEDLAEETAEDELEERLEDSLDDDAEDLAEERAEEAAEDRLDDDDWEDDFEDRDDDLNDDLDELDDELDRDDPDERFDEDDRLAEALEERLLDMLEDDLDSLIELNTGEIIVRRQMLVVTDDALLNQLSSHPQVTLQSRRSLSSLDVSLGTFNVKEDMPLETLRAELRETYPGLSVDFNHGYELSQNSAETAKLTVMLSALYRPAPSGRMRAAIGLLDGPVNASHPAFAGARLQQKSFVSRPSERDRAHGTAVASLLVGQTPDWQGLAPEAELYAASVFSEQAQYGSIATTQGLITALDWLVSRPVEVINISLAGPANQTLETVLQRVRELGILPVAAAGNAGPLADPQYPAAYPTVVAVTAIDGERALYRHAVRGQHLDFAAYGVNVSAASGDEGFSEVTGTSFAAPVVTALLVRYLTDTGSLDEALQALTEDTLDLGEPGKDPRFGHGLPGESQLQQ